MPMDEMFGSQAIEVTTREKIDILKNNLTGLEEILRDIRNSNPKTMKDVEMLAGQIKQLYFDYQSNINETEYDIMREFRDVPGFNDFFKLVMRDKEGSNAKTMKDTDEEDLLLRWARFKSKSSGELGNSHIRLLPLESKRSVFDAILKEILFLGMQKFSNYILKGNAVGLTNPKLNDEAEKEWAALGCSRKASALRTAFEVEKGALTEEEAIELGRIANKMTLAGARSDLKKKREQMMEKNGGSKVAIPVTIGK